MAKEEVNNVAPAPTSENEDLTYTIDHIIDTSPYDDFLDNTVHYTVPGIEYKFNEGNLIDEFKTYVNKTYEQHYSKDKFQATEFIVDGGHGTGFCIGNVLKYAQRYGKKGTHADARKDLMKVLHYALIQLYIHDSKTQE